MFKKYFLTLITFISYSLVYSEKNLFDGKSLDGWDGNPVHWSVKEGAIVGENTKENPTKGFLDWFFEMHAHTNTTTDILVLKQRTVEKVSLEKLIAKTRLPKLVIYTFYKSDTIVKKWYRPPDKLRKAYLFNYSLRGPPSLG